MEMYSKRFDKTYEVEAYVRDDGTQIASFPGLRALIYELGPAVTVKADPVLEAPVFGFKVTISDDTGAEGVGVGSVNISDEKLTKVAKEKVLETAYSRAYSSAIIDYFGFDSRSTNTVVEEAPQPEEKPEPAPAPKAEKKAPAKKAAPVKKAEATPAPENADDPGEYVITFGNALKGKKVKELTESQLTWLAGDDFQARNATAKAAKEAVKKFMASK